MSRTKLLSVLGLAGAVCAPIASEAFAQEMASDEVIVTAQRREQSLQDVPLTVTVLGAEALSNLGIDTPAELAAQTPGFKVFSIYGEGTNPTFFMRGVGLLDFGDVTETPVALNLDDVYLGTQAAQAAPIFDVERVEVLKGPQGTLYGRNATGGVINVISARPTSQFEGRVGAQLGSFGQKIVEASASGPLESWARARLAIRSNRDDGWQRSITTNRDGFGQTDVASGRAQVEFDIATRSSLLLRADYARSDGTSVLYPLTGLLQSDLATPCLQKDAAANLCFNSAGERGVRDPRVGLSNVPQLRNEFEFRLGSATFTHDFGGVTLTSITAVQSVDKLFEEDADAAAIDLGFTVYTLDAEQVTQEVRLSGGDQGSLAWILGAYYFDEARSSSVAAPPTFATLAEQKSNSWAMFARADYQLSRQITATAGVRYTEDDKRIDVVSPGFMPKAKRSLNEESVTGTLGVSWSPSDDLLWYANVATGYKAGGFNANFVFDPDSIGPVAPENIASFEVGLKSEFWAGRVVLNGAAFAYEYRDIQSVALESTSQLSITRLISLGDARVVGVDGDITVRPLESLKLNVGLGLLDSELKSTAVQSTPFPPGFVPVNGNPLPMAPEVSLNWLAEYNVGLGNLGSLTAQVDGNWRSEFSFSASGASEENERSEGYGLLNARVRWKSPDERYLVEGFVENASDEEYFAFNANIFSDNASGAWGKPRTWGVRVQADF